MIFGDTLEALRRVKEGCFGAVPDPDYIQIVKQFEAAWFEIYIEHDVWFTNKCHVIIDHIPQIFFLNNWAAPPNIDNYYIMPEHSFVTMKTAVSSRRSPIRTLRSHFMSRIGHSL